MRYHGRDNRHYVSSNKVRGYRHPAHNNGENSILTSWWGGNSSGYDGQMLPPRETEWDVEHVEGSLTQIPLTMSDWVFNTEIPPCSLEYFRVRGGRSNQRHVAYFKLCIACRIPSSNTTGCPVIFGPESEVFSLNPKYSSGTAVNRDLRYAGWSIKIGD